MRQSRSLPRSCIVGCSAFSISPTSRKKGIKSAGSGKVVEDFPVGMDGEALGNLLVIVLDRANHLLELATDQLDAHHQTINQCWFIGQWHGLLNDL